MNQTLTLITFTFLLLLGLCGCGSSEVADADDHHLEHFVPRHKPPNFAAAIEEIEHRAEHLTDHARHGHADETDEFQELLDIVNWLPELAADSDLNETDWNTANATGSSIAIVLQQRLGAGGNLSLKDLSEAIETHIQTLLSLVAAAGEPEPTIRHEHDHEHGHDHEHH